MSWLAPARVTRVSYPGVWLGDRIWATHGHYLDHHLHPGLGLRPVAPVAARRRPRHVAHGVRAPAPSRPALARVAAGAAADAARRHRHARPLLEPLRVAARGAAQHGHGAGDGQAPRRTDAPRRDAGDGPVWRRAWASTPTGCCSGMCTAAGRSAMSRGPVGPARGWSTPAPGSTSRCWWTARPRPTPTGRAARCCSRMDGRRACVGSARRSRRRAAPRARTDGGQRRMRWLSPNSCHR